MVVQIDPVELQKIVDMRVRGAALIADAKPLIISPISEEYGKEVYGAYPQYVGGFYIAAYLLTNKTVYVYCPFDAEEATNPRRARALLNNAWYMLEYIAGGGEL